MTDVAIRSFSSVAGTLTATEPTGAQSGDVLIALCMHANSDIVFIGPAGWTNFNSSDNAIGPSEINAYSITRGASAPGYTFSGPPASNSRITIYALTGVNTITPIDDTSGSNEDADSTPPTGDITTTRDGEIILVAIAIDSGAAVVNSVPSGFTLDTGSGTRATASMLQSTAGHYTGNWTLSAVAGSASIVIALKNKSHAKSTSGTAGSVSGTIAKSTRKVARGIAGTISGIMTFGNTFLKSLTGTCGSLSGALAKRSFKAFSGTVGLLSATLDTLQSSGSIFVKSVNGSINSISGTISRRINKSLTGSTGSLFGVGAKNFTQLISGSFTMSGQVSTLISSFRNKRMKAGKVVSVIMRGGNTKRWQ